MITKDSPRMCEKRCACAVESQPTVKKYACLKWFQQRIISKMGCLFSQRFEIQVKVVVQELKGWAWWVKVALWKLIKSHRRTMGSRPFLICRWNSGVDSLAARGCLPYVGGDCGREGLPASVNVHCKQNRTLIFFNAKNIPARRKYRHHKPKFHSWFWTFRLTDFF